MEHAYLILKCSKEYKEKVKKMAKSKDMNISQFIRFLIGKQEDIKR